MTLEQMKQRVKEIEDKGKRWTDSGDWGMYLENEAPDYKQLIIDIRALEEEEQ